MAKSRLPRPVLPPGTLLQLMYLQERLATISVGHFIEIGPGSGEITRLLLLAGWTGQVYELESETVNRLKNRFASELGSGQLKISQSNYLDDTTAKDADLVISCMVMEHLEDEQEAAFMVRSTARLKQGGLMIGIVPASPKHWGIEDKIAGHCRRYTRTTIKSLVAAHGWELTHISGLTFPVSNFLLPVSNYLVEKNERNKLKLSTLERTKQSGRRNVSFKTHFPNILSVFLNEVVLFPFHWVQKKSSLSPNSLVLYFEAKP